MTCWQLLGIAPSNDIAAIRRGYAAKLKAIDMDRDTDGFQTLRQARDEAIWRAENDALEDLEHADECEADWGLGDLEDDLELAEPLIEHSIAHAVAVDPRPADRDDPSDTLYALLEPHDGDLERSFPDSATADAMRAAFDAIVNDPRMDEIAFYDEQERWLAGVLAMAWPTSEPLVASAVATFGWNRDAGRVDQDWSVEFLVQRAAAVEFERQVAHPKHRYHSEWRELTKPATERTWRNRLLRRRTVNALLQRIRTDYPTLEGRLDPWRVSMWEQTEPRRIWPIVWLAIIALNVLIRLPGCDREPKAPPAAQVMTLADAFAASSFRTTVSLTDIRNTNSKFWGRLTSQLNAAKTDGASYDRIVATIDRALADHVRDVLADPPYPVLRSAAALLVARGNDAARFGWADCTALLFGGGTPPRATPGRFDTEVADLRRQALLTEPIATPKPAAGRGRLDPDVARLIQQRLRLDDATFTEALMNRGAAKDRCETRIAAIQVALDLPQDRGEPLLRILAD